MTCENMSRAGMRRRPFLGTLAVLLSSVPIFKTLLGAPARADELPHLTEDDQVAEALKYRHDANIAARTDKGGVAAQDQFCHNCMFVQGDESAEWRPCQIFPGKAVNTNGWCVSWMQKSQ